MNLCKTVFVFLDLELDAGPPELKDLLHNPVPATSGEIPSIIPEWVTNPPFYLEVSWCYCEWLLTNRSCLVTPPPPPLLCWSGGFWGLKLHISILLNFSELINIFHYPAKSVSHWGSALVRNIHITGNVHPSKTTGKGCFVPNRTLFSRLCSCVLITFQRQAEEDSSTGLRNGQWGGGKTRDLCWWADLWKLSLLTTTKSIFHFLAEYPMNNATYPLTLRSCCEPTHGQ